VRETVLPQTQVPDPDSSTTTTSAFSMSSEIDKIRLQTLHDLSATMSTAEDPDRLFRQVLVAQMKVTGARVGTLFLSSPQGKEQASLSMDYESRVLPTSELFFSNAILERVAEGRPILEVAPPEDGDGAGMQSTLCVPFVNGGRCLGCVYLVHDTTTGMFTEGAQQIALVLAVQAAVLIENATLIARYRGLAENLEQKVHAQTLALTDKNHELEDKTVKLLETERIKAILTNMIVHDIKNSASGITGTMSLLARIDIPDRYKKLIRHATDACADVTGLSVNMLDIARMDEGKFAMKRCPISLDWFRRVFEKNSCNPVFAEKNIQLSYEEPREHGFLSADEYLLDRILLNLFNNAAKYTPAGGRAEFSVVLGEDGGTQITLFSTGAPIPQEYRERIFEKYSRVEEQQTTYSKGLGLFFCRMAMHAHHGSIWVDSDATGNYFRMSFPTMVREMQLTA